MLAALFDLGGQVRSITPVHAPPLLAHPRPLLAPGEQLVMRVLPLVVLFDLHEDAESWYYLFGFSSAALGIAVAYAVTYRKSSTTGDGGDGARPASPSQASSATGASSA